MLISELPARCISYVRKTVLINLTLDVIVNHVCYLQGRPDISNRTTNSKKKLFFQSTHLLKQFSIMRAGRSVYRFTNPQGDEGSEPSIYLVKAL